MNSPATRQRSGPPATDVLEAAVRLLRRAPVATLLLHAVGSVPCLLGVLYFVADMSRSALAYERLEVAALGMALLYLWMKCWQAVFAARLRALLLEETPARWTFARAFRLVAHQAVLQPLGLLVRPPALLITLPYVWTATFFHNVTVLGDGQPRSLRELCREAGAQARLWPRQAHALTFLLFLFGLFVVLNVALTLVLLPQLARMFLGIESAFTRHLGGMWNATFFTAVLAGAYLCLDPIRKAAAVVRCFHGSAVRTGADLEVQLRALRPSLAQAAALLAALLLAAGGPVARAGTPATPTAVEPQELGRSIDSVLARREFSWRLPRGEAPEKEQELTWLGKARRDFRAWLGRQAWTVGRWVGRTVRKLSDWLSPDRSTPDLARGAWDWRGATLYLLYGLLGVALLLLGVMIFRARRRLRLAPVAAQAIAAVPDLTREDVTADQLPEDGWLRLARDLLERGELRLALRASYLAGLAHLGQRELILLARHKSNRDYDRELRRRARGDAELVATFDRSLRAFEQSWYGDHEVTRASLEDFTRGLERIRAC